MINERIIRHHSTRRCYQVRVFILFLEEIEHG